MIYLSWQIYSDICSPMISDTTNILEISFVPKIDKKGTKWSKMAQHGPKWSDTIKNGDIGQNTPKQCGSNIRIFKYIQIYLDQYIDLLKNTSIFVRANLFVYSFVISLSWGIYSDIHSFNIYGHEYIRKFLCPRNISLSHTELWVIAKLIRPSRREASTRGFVIVSVFLYVCHHSLNQWEARRSHKNKHVCNGLVLC